MSIDFHRLIEAIDNNRLIIIDYIDYIDWLPMIDFHRLGTPGQSRRLAFSRLLPFPSSFARALVSRKNRETSGNEADKHLSCHATPVLRDRRGGPELD